MVEDVDLDGDRTSQGTDMTNLVANFIVVTLGLEYPPASVIVTITLKSLVSSLSSYLNTDFCWAAVCRGIFTEVGPGPA